jgi:hypothetical protein
MVVLHCEPIGHVVLHSHEPQRVVVRFSRPINFWGFSAEEARTIAGDLLEHADLVDGSVPCSGREASHAAH